MVVEKHPSIGTVFRLYDMSGESWKGEVIESYFNEASRLCVKARGLNDKPGDYLLLEDDAWLFYVNNSFIVIDKMPSS
jgi:hypothetical protein